MVTKSSFGCIHLENFYQLSVFSELGLNFYLTNGPDFCFLIKMFRALPLVPLEKVEAFFNALVNSALFKQPYSDDPKKYKKIKDGKYETEEIFREKLQKFAIYMRVSIISYMRIFS